MPRPLEPDPGNAGVGKRVRGILTAGPAWGSAVFSCNPHAPVGPVECCYYLPLSVLLCSHRIARSNSLAAGCDDLAGAKQDNNTPKAETTYAPQP